MYITTEQAKDLAVLRTITLPDGLRLSLTENEYNSDTTINDFDCYGKVEWVRPNEYNGRQNRPDGFDGRAEKINTQRDTYWWQPPADIPGWYTDPTVRQSLRRTVTDILKWGFTSYTLRAERQCPCCDKWDEVGADYAGGYEPFMDTDDIADVIQSMAYEIELENVPA